MIATTLARYRILASRVLIVASAVVLLFTRHSWDHGSLTDISLEAVGYTLLVAAAFIRLWCSLYIYGYKRKMLVTLGPYSVTRNPLYLGSLIGATGLGLASENLLFGALLLAFFVAYYPWVVLNEERELWQTFGAEYEQYCSVVPRFVPRFSLFREPDCYEIHPKRLRRAFLDSMWFLLSIVGFEVTEVLHNMAALPVLLHTP